MKPAPLGKSDPHPLTSLGDDDLDMIATFVLASGSIKELSREYGVSYPTMRTRLNELIERLRAALRGEEPDPLTEYLAVLIEEGKIAPAVANRVRDLHRRGMRGSPR